MRIKRMRLSLICAFVLVIGATLAGVAFADNLVGDAGYLLAPGIWIVFGMFDVDTHDLLPVIAAQMINILIYWMAFARLLSLSWKGGHEKMETAGQP